LTRRFEVGERDAGRRLDAWLSSVGEMSRTEAERLAGGGFVTVDGATVSKSHRVRASEVVEVRFPQSSDEETEASLPEIKVQDEHLAVISKPAGLLTHRTPGGKSASLVDVLQTMMPLAEAAGKERPGIVHRLDKETSGLLVVAKTDEAYQRLVDAMRQRKIVRRYLALVSGNFSMPTGRIEAPVGRSQRNPTRMEVTGDGRDAVTDFEVKEDLQAATLVDAGLQTGRTHQIRVHFAHIGHPVIGDRVYGRTSAEFAARIGLRRPFLHAHLLEFDHPLTGKAMRVGDPLPPDLAEALVRARSLIGLSEGGSPGVPS
jgi:23S rRNA pseudouridine1911/1915/1917 synthase